MFPLRGKLIVERPAHLTVRRWRAILREAHERVGAMFLREIQPRHFQPGAASRYGYRRRSEKYLRRKRQLAARGIAIEGGRTDLVLTGLLRRAVTQFGRVRGFPTRATVTAPLPGYVPVRRRTLKNPPLFEELTRLRIDEARRLRQRLVDHLRRKGKLDRQTIRFG